MSKTPPRALVAPIPEMHDFVASLKEVTDTLYQGAHDHTPLTAAPSAKDGAVGDIRHTDDGTTQKIWVKTGSGWKSAVLS